MLRGNSVHHVNQDEGKIYSITEVNGYYNNLTEKVSRFGLEGNQIPKSYVDSGDEIYFAIEIFQYGLAAYDLYLLNNDNEMLGKAIACADWAINNQKPNGAWAAFSHKTPNHPFSSMAQGEGISLLIRVYKETKDEKYINAIHKAKDFMLTPISEGGTTKYEGEKVYFYEFTHDPLVLNGWIFSTWGLMDYVKWFRDEKVQAIVLKTINTIKESISEFDTGYWSKYDISKRICSPFYHNLHIAQLRVMYKLTGEKVFMDYADLWESYAKKSLFKKRAFLVKAFQKIFE